MYTVVVVVILILTHASAITGEPGHATALVVKPFECVPSIIKEPDGSECVNRTETVLRVAAGLPCLNQRTIHNAPNSTAHVGVGWAASSKTKSLVLRLFSPFSHPVQSILFEEVLQRWHFGIFLNHLMHWLHPACEDFRSPARNGVQGGVAF